MRSLFLVWLAIFVFRKVRNMFRRNRHSGGNGKKGLVSGITAFALVMLLFSGGLRSIGGIVLGLLLGLGVGAAVGIMAQGLDLKTHNRKKPYEYGDSNVVKEAEDEEKPAPAKAEEKEHRRFNVTVTRDDDSPVNRAVTASDQLLAAIDSVPLTDDKAANETITKGKEMLRQLCTENEAIPDKKLSWQMDETVKTCIQILQTISEKPQKSAQVRKFMNYYLPTTVKILASYRTISESGVSKSEIDYAKVEAGRCLEMVITACQKQLDNLYKETKLDMSTDIDVLEQMMKRDGYIDSDISVSAPPPKSAGTAASAQMQVHEAPILKVEKQPDDSGRYYSENRKKSNNAVE